DGRRVAAGCGGELKSAGQTRLLADAKLRDVGERIDRFAPVRVAGGDGHRRDVGDAWSNRRGHGARVRFGCRVGRVRVAAAENRKRPELVDGSLGQERSLFDGAAPVGLDVNDRRRLKAPRDRQGEYDDSERLAHTKKMTHKRGKVPLNRALSKLGVLSRAQATDAIREGRVRV